MPDGLRGMHSGKARQPPQHSYASQSNVSDIFASSVDERDAASTAMGMTSRKESVRSEERMRSQQERKRRTYIIGQMEASAFAHLLHWNENGTKMLSSLVAACQKYRELCFKLLASEPAAEVLCEHATEVATVCYAMQTKRHRFLTTLQRLQLKEAERSSQWLRDNRVSKPKEVPPRPAG
eukprot:Sspe_Gene.88215::Locus_60271_Transcript_1_1_Confidence_1.000_Length_610::g.88215::m.88215